MRARDNPFAVDRVLALRTRLPPGESWEGLLDRFEALSRRAALVGPHGAGKTTLLEDLEPWLAGRGLRLRKVTLRAGERRLGSERARALFEGLEAGDLLLVDGAEQLAPWAWQVLRRRARRAAGLLITCHRPGWLPTLLECRTSPELLADLLVELVGPAETAALPVAELFERHRGDLRAVLRGLYDVWARGR
jgi:hypothetical protein